jgi:hypothetical protein
MRLSDCEGEVMNHVVLMGDSILDNGAYVADGEPIIEQLRSRLSRDDIATLLAVDGSVIETMPKQINKVPADGTHLVVSVGGNNALEYSPILRDSQTSGPALIRQLADAQVEFADKYRQMLGAILALHKRTAVCTIYDGVPGLEPEAVAALSVFNDAIIRAAVEFGVPVLDLRFVCNEIADYAKISPIEPSERGGSKIARAIQRVITGHDFTQAQAVIYR